MRLPSFLRRTAKAVSWFHAKTERGSDGPMSLRRWEAAKTSRLNKAHWTPVTGQTINQDLVSYLETLRTRAEFEASNNPDVEGIINTHIVDVIGETGPALQVLSKKSTYNAKLEQLWRDWWAMPDINGELAGVDLLQQWWRSLWTCGEFLGQILYDKKSKDAVRLRLYSLSPHRLGTPPQFAGDADVLLGVRRNKTGKPLAYSIDNSVEQLLGGQWFTDYEEIPAADIIHGFRILEPGQVRGIPWLATGLPVAADLRDYDNQVMDAARAAADHGVLLKTNHQDAPFLKVNESTEIERRTMRTLPPGWEAQQMTPQQPTTKYVEFHDERLRSLGRPISMPLMMIKLDSRKHNYSSARFDAQVYQRGNAVLQGWLARRVLNRLVDLVAVEPRVAGKLPKRPDSVIYQWNWPKPPHVDPSKEAKAATERLNNGSSSLRDECQALGHDWEEMIVQRQREAEALEAAGLPAAGVRPQGAKTRRSPQRSNDNASD